MGCSAFYRPWFAWVSTWESHRGPTLMVYLYRLARHRDEFPHFSSLSTRGLFAYRALCNATKRRVKVRKHNPCTLRGTGTNPSARLQAQYVVGCRNLRLALPIPMVGAGLGACLSPLYF